MEKNKKLKKNNSREILQLFLHLYQGDMERKTRLENKAIGYLLFISIILAVSAAIMLFTLNRIEYWNIGEIVMLISLFAIFYFFIYTFIFTLRAHDKRKITCLPDPNDFVNKWKKKKSKFLGGISQSLLDYGKMNEKALDDLLFNVDMCRIFIYFSFTSFVIFIITFFIKLIY